MGFGYRHENNNKVIGEADTSHQQDDLHRKDCKYELFDRLDNKEKFENELKKNKEGTK